ncbi:MAG: hypothetical protein AAFQ51_11235 [Pseudomonadota bacterium]
MRQIPTWPTSRRHPAHGRWPPGGDGGSRGNQCPDYNTGVYRVGEPITPEGLDLRFVVNTVAPYAPTKGLLPAFDRTARVVNLSSAAQAPYDLAALRGERHLDTHEAYAQSKLAITAWTMELARAHPDGPSFCTLNPGSLLATAMTNEGFGVSGNDVGIGVDGLVWVCLSPEFDDKSGAYFDNDAGMFSDPHPFAASAEHGAALMAHLDQMVR